MNDKPPSIQEWKDLYEAAIEFKKIKPWNWMWDTDIFGVQNPITGETGYCCVMGGAGEHFALAVYLGSEGLNGYLKLQSKKNYPSLEDMLNFQKLLMASFEDREYLQKEDFQLIKDLTEIQGCTGNEAKIRQYIFDQVKSYCDNIEIDTIGNLICHLNGKKNTSEPKHNILLDAHMDEIGFMVRYIDKDGFIRFVAVGGENARILPGQTVVIHSSSGKDIIGVIGEKAIHLISKDER